MLIMHVGTQLFAAVCAHVDTHAYHICIQTHTHWDCKWICMSCRGTENGWLCCFTSSSTHGRMKKHREKRAADKKVISSSALCSITHCALCLSAFYSLSCFQRDTALPFFYFCLFMYFSRVMANVMKPNEGKNKWFPPFTTNLLWCHLRSVEPPFFFASTSPSSFLLFIPCCRWSDKKPKQLEQTEQSTHRVRISKGCLDLDGV